MPRVILERSNIAEDPCFSHAREKKTPVLFADPVFLRAFQVAKKRKVEEHPARTSSEVAEDGKVEKRIVSVPCNFVSDLKMLPIFRVGIVIYILPIHTRRSIYPNQVGYS